MTDKNAIIKKIVEERRQLAKEASDIVGQTKKYSDVNELIALVDEYKELLANFLRSAQALERIKVKTKSIVVH